MARKIEAACGRSVAGKRIAVLGLTFKPRTDDMSDAPSLVIAPELQAAGARVVTYDPEGVKTGWSLLPRVEFVDSACGRLRAPKRQSLSPNGTNSAPSILIVSRPPPWRGRSWSICAISLRSRP